jgi:hypothetical protein
MMKINNDIEVDTEADEFKELDEDHCAKEAEAFAKQIAAEAKKKKVRKAPRRARSYRQCTAGQCHGKPTHSVVQVVASIGEDSEGSKRINFQEDHLILPACEPHATGMLQRFKRIGIPNVRMEVLPVREPKKKKAKTTKTNKTTKAKRAIRI